MLRMHAIEHTQQKFETKFFLYNMDTPDKQIHHSIVTDGNQKAPLLLQLREKRETSNSS